MRRLSLANIVVIWIALAALSQTSAGPYIGFAAFFLIGAFLIPIEFAASAVGYRITDSQYGFGFFLLFGLAAIICASVAVKRRQAGDMGVAHRYFAYAISLVGASLLLFLSFQAFLSRTL